LVACLAHRNICEYRGDVAEVNQDAPFEMAVNGNLLIEQPAWNEVPQVATGGSCQQDVTQSGGNVVCDIDLTTSLDDSV
jgi:hypothetical protein